VTDIITFDNYTEMMISGGTTTTTKYYSIDGQRVALRTGGILSYLLVDALGSNTIALDSTGNTQAVQLFAPYGTARYSQGTMPTTYNFTSQRLDSQTGLLYYGFRYYDPLSGRFTRADTVETNAAGRDPYAYVKGNPETKIDPSGHSGGPVGHVDPYDALVEIWYISIELMAGNAAYGEERFGLGGHSIENAMVPTLSGTGRGGTITEADLQRWLKQLASLLQRGGNVGHVGIPDIINKSLHLIYDVKTGDTQGDPLGRSDFPSRTTQVAGWAQVRWYTTLANQSTDSFWNDGYVWNPGDLDHDQPLARALQRCGGACSIPIGNNLFLIITYGGPGLLIYRVVSGGTRVRIPDWQSRYSYWLPWLLGVGLAVAIASSGLGGSGRFAPPLLAPAGGGCSFMVNTLVGTPAGEKAIGRLVVGDLVLAYNPLTHNIETQPVVHVWVHVDNDLVDVVIMPIDQMHRATKQGGIRDLIHTTSTHPFLTEEEGFMPVGQLRIAMHVVQANGDVGVVTVIWAVPGSMIMYNLEVANDHTFTVGNDKWIVHNACRPII
jgi:RHS repeat-associated protein